MVDHDSNEALGLSSLPPFYQLRPELARLDFFRENYIASKATALLFTIWCQILSIDAKNRMLLEHIKVVTYTAL
jgi:hypothetical protein